MKQPEMTDAQIDAAVLARRRLRAPLDPVHGDLLPPMGSKVLIHLARQDAWVEHTVVGYYVHGAHAGGTHLHRVFVRVKDSEGYSNARMLCDIRPVEPSSQPTATCET
jgi:hypothetical protein